MRNLSRYFVAVCVVVAGLTAGASSADACTCAVTPCGVAGAEVVFEATVVSIEQVVGDSTSLIGKEKRVVLKDVRSLRGDAPTIIFTGNNGEVCGYTFRPGERYLIDAHRSNDGQFTTSICSLTSHSRDAAPLIAYLEALKKSPDEMRVWGSVGRITGWPGFNRYRTPIAGAEVRLTGPTRVTLSTDGNGEFVAAGLPVGRYAVTARVDGKPVPADESWSTFFLHKDGYRCEELNISLEPNGRVQGSVVSEDGAPVRDIEVDILSADDLLEATGYRPGVSLTVPQGRFAVGDLPPGRYFAAVNPRIGPVEFNPYFEVETLPFVVVDGQTTTAPTLRVRRATMIDMAGEVRDSKGQPMRDMQLTCQVQLRNGTRPCRPDVKTDGSGRFTVRLWKDQRYIISLGPDYAPLAWTDFIADGQPLVIRARQQ